MRRAMGLWTATLAASLAACGGSGVTTPAAAADGGGTSGGTGGGAASADLPAVFAKFSDAVDVSLDGDWVVIRSTGVPEHPSPYFDPGDPRYAPYDGDNPGFQLNPNRIREQTFTFRIPLHPTEGPHEATPLGPIGVALDGVALFNQYAAGRQPLTFEVNSFDQYNGHPQQTGVYHYHVEPLWLTRDDEGALVGFLLDGFPVYGPVEDGRRLTDADLDEYHGHFGPTPDYPDGIYHYHVTAEDPYINGAGFYGAAGTVSQ